MEQFRVKIKELYLEIKKERESLKIPAKLKPLEKKATTVIKKKAEPQKLELKSRLEKKAPSLPGLENIRKRQEKESLKKAAESKPVQKKQSFVIKPKAKPQGIKPLLIKPKSDESQGESLPGLGAIRKKQLEQAR